MTDKTEYGAEDEYQENWEKSGTFDVVGVTFDSFTTSDGEHLIDRVILDVPDAPNNQITFKPRRLVRESKDVGVITTTETSSERYPANAFVDAYEDLAKVQKATDGGATVQMTANVSFWDMSLSDSADGDRIVAYIDRDDEETLEFEVEE